LGVAASSTSRVTSTGFMGGQESRSESRLIDIP
jgi:hypothetical protein